MKTSLIAFLSIFLFAFTCEGDKKTEDLNDLEKEAASSIETAGLKAEDFKDNIDQLLTLEIASEVSGLPSGEAKKKHSKSFSLESVSYEWKSDRTKSIEISKGNPMKIPVKNSIELSWVKNTTLEEFKRNYHNPTAEELKRAEEAIGNKMNELESEGKATNEQTSTASEVAKSSMSKFSVEEVPNLGTYSVFVNSGIFGAKMRDLKVFYRGISFTLTTDLSDEAVYNDKKSIETAKLIIKKLD